MISFAVCVLAVQCALNVCNFVIVASYFTLSALSTTCLLNFEAAVFSCRLCFLRAFPF